MASGPGRLWPLRALWACTALFGAAIVAGLGLCGATFVRLSLPGLGLLTDLGRSLGLSLAFGGSYRGLWGL